MVNQSLVGQLMWETEFNLLPYFLIWMEMDNRISTMPICKIQHNGMIQMVMA